MKKCKIVIVFLLLGTIISCQQKKQTDDPEVLKQVLTEYFDGIKNLNKGKLDSLTTKDFILFEDGKIWNNDSLVNFGKQFKSFTGEWKLYNMTTFVDGMSGYIVYEDHGDLVINDTLTLHFNWLESANFKKVDGNWKLAFLHSTTKK